MGFKIVRRFVKKEPRLNSLQVQYLANVCSAIAQIAIGSMVVPFLIPGLEPTRMQMILLGIFTAATFWLLGLRILRGVKS